MNVTEGSVKHWLNVASYDENNSNGSNGSAGSNNATTNANETDQDNLNPQLWDLRWFALLSGPLLFGTIIIPLITGPTIQYLCQSYVTLRVYWRLGVVLLAIAYLITVLVLKFNPTSDRLLAGAGLQIVCNFMLSCLVIYQLCSTWRVKEYQRIWSYPITLALVSFPTTQIVVLLREKHNFILFGFVPWAPFIVIQILFYHRERVATNRAETE